MKLLTCFLALLSTAQFVWIIHLESAIRKESLTLFVRSKGQVNGFQFEAKLGGSKDGESDTPEAPSVPPVPVNPLYKASEEESQLLPRDPSMADDEGIVDGSKSTSSAGDLDLPPYKTREMEELPPLPFNHEDGLIPQPADPVPLKETVPVKKSSPTKTSTTTGKKAPAQTLAKVTSKAPVKKAVAKSTPKAPVKKAVAKSTPKAPVKKAVAKSTSKASSSNKKLIAKR